jgi:hypothetical protein
MRPWLMWIAARAPWLLYVVFVMMWPAQILLSMVIGHSGSRPGSCTHLA